ncbi:MAG: hypothetical protein U5L03_00290 [Burkholderiaceae bacterium]|nr:hypothetical protein [Burkholderiaceae bacterium]
MPFDGAAVSGGRNTASKVAASELSRGEIALHQLVRRQAKQRRHARALLGGGWDQVRLRIIDVLQRMLEPAQEHVLLGQPRAGGRRQQVQLRQHCKRAERALATQARLASAAHHLERLRDELDLADAAAAELDVVLVRAVAGGAARALLLRLGADHLVQATQRGDRIEVEILAEHERRHRGLVRLHLGRELRRAGEHRRRDHAPLEPGEALPLAALPDQVLLQHGVRHHQRAGVAIGSQPQVDAEHEALRGHVRQGRGHAPRQLLEELVVRQRPARVGELANGARLAAFVVDVDQVEVGRDVQFAAAALAHRHRQQVLRCAVGVGRDAVHLRQLARMRGHQPLHRQLGQQRHAAGDLVEAGHARHVAHDHAEQRLPPQYTQGGAQRVGRAAGGWCGRRRRDPRRQARCVPRHGGQIHQGSALPLSVVRQAQCRLRDEAARVQRALRTRGDLRARIVHGRRRRRQVSHAPARALACDSLSWRSKEHAAGMIAAGHDPGSIQARGVTRSGRTSADCTNGVYRAPRPGAFASARRRCRTNALHQCAERIRQPHARRRLPRTPSEPCGPIAITVLDLRPPSLR